MTIHTQIFHGQIGNRSTPRRPCAQSLFYVDNNNSGKSIGTPTQSRTLVCYLQPTLAGRRCTPVA